eukprot:5139609-Prymnesium_polylepis.1
MPAWMPASRAQGVSCALVASTLFRPSVDSPLTEHTVCVVCGHRTDDRDPCDAGARTGRGTRDADGLG